MADEPNKPINSSNKSMNGDDKLARIQARRSNELPEYTIKQQELEDRIKIEEAKFAERQSEHSATTDQAERLKSYSRLESQATKVTQSEERLSMYEDRYAQRVNAQAANEISTHTKYDNVNSRTTTMSSGQKYFSQIQSDRSMLEVPSEVLEQRIDKRQQRISTLGTELAGQTRGLAYGDFTPEMKTKANEIGNLEENVALDKRLQKVQGKAGMTTEKRQYSTEELIERADKISGKDSLRKDVAGGKFGSFDEELAKLTEMTSKVKEAEKAWVDSLKNATDENGDLTEDYKDMSKDLQDAKKNLSKQADIVQETERQGGGGNRLNNARGWMGVASAVTKTASTIGLDYELEQTNQRAAFANMANTQYSNANKFAQGDMSAMLDLMKGDAFAKQYSSTLNNRAVGFASANIATNTADAVLAGAAAVGEGLTADAGGALKVASAAAGSTSQAALLTARVGYGIEQGAYGAKGYQSAKALSSAMNAIPADTLQNYYDTYRGAYEGGVGLGGQRSTFMKSMTSEQNRKAMAGAGITAKEAIGLAGSSVGMIGDVEDYGSLAIKAARAQQRGALGKEDYMSSVGQLTAVGGGSADLESIMSKAVSAGMENAKNINQMVQSTVALASVGAASGLNNTTAASDMLLAGTQSLRDIGVNKNIATGAAANTLAGMAAAGRKKGSLADLMERAETKEIYGDKIGSIESMNMASLSTSDIKTMLAGGSNARLTAMTFGVEDVIGVNKDGSMSKKNRALAEKLLTSKSQKETREGTGQYAFMTPEYVKEVEEFKSGKRSFQDVSSKTRGMFKTITGNTLAGGAGSSAPNEIAKKVQDFESSGFPFKSRNQPTGEEAAIQRQKQQAAIFDVTKFGAGEEGMKEVGGMSGMVDALTAALKSADPTKMAKAVSEAATNLKAPGTLFESGAKKFDGAVNKFISQMDKMGVGGIDTPPDKTKKIPKITGHTNTKL